MTSEVFAKMFNFLFRFLFTIKPQTIFVGVFLIFSFSPAQSPWKKVSEVKNYSSDEIYSAAPKTFDITQGANGLMYFANDYGLLEFTGISWEILIQPTNRSRIRSLLSTNTSRLYLGSNNEIGYTERNHFNQIYYQSLNDKLPSACISFSEVWEVFEIQNSIYFCSSKLFIKYDPVTDQVNCIYPDHGIKYATEINNAIYFIDNSGVLNKLENQKIVPAARANILSEYLPKFIVPFKKGSFLIATEKNGVLLLKNDTIIPWGNDTRFNLKDVDLSSGILISNGVYCFGTINNGILFLDKNGKLLQKLNRENKLLSNTVLDLFLDQSGNLWAALDGGISYIELQSPFYTLSEENGIYGSTYDVKKYKDTLYIGTSNGLYYNYWPQDSFDTTFKPVLGVKGQIWNLSIVDDYLLVGGDKGSFVVQNKEAVSISNIEGGWNFVEIPNHKDLMLQGTYSGLLIYQKIDGVWQLRNKIEGFSETCREIKIDKNLNVWISHGYKGVFRLRLDSDLKSVTSSSLYDQDRGFPSNLFVSILETDDQLLFGTQLGVYEYDDELDKMVLNVKYTDILTNHNLVRKVEQVSENKVAFIMGYDRDDDVGVLKFKANGDYEINRVPFQRLRSKLIPAFETIIEFSNGDIGFTSKKGLKIYRENLEIDYKKEFNTQFRNIWAKDSVLYGHMAGYMKEMNTDSISQPLPFEFNKLNFSYIAPFYEYPEVVYKTYLEGLDDKWSDWSSESQKEYNFLPPGIYTFRVKAKNVYDEIGNEASYKFEIKPPWYRSSSMYFLYALLSAILIYLFISFKNKQRKKVIEKLKIAHEKEIEIQQIKFEEKRLKAKNEKIKENNKKLKKDLGDKNKELASSAMQTVQMDNELLKLKSRLGDLYSSSEGSIKKEIKQVINSIDSQVNDNKNWKQFETHFNQIHDNSLDRLREKYPELNHRELRLCAYLKLNLSSKEIAPLMGISHRGIESLRFRVRKKMNLDTSTNLTDFIIRF